MDKFVLVCTDTRDCNEDFSDFPAYHLYEGTEKQCAEKMMELVQSDCKDLPNYEVQASGGDAFDDFTRKLYDSEFSGTFPLAKELVGKTYAELGKPSRICIKDYCDGGAIGYKIMQATSL